MKYLNRLFLGMTLAWASCSANAEIILNEWLINNNGVISEGDLGASLPGSANVLDARGLGTINFLIDSPGANYIVAYFDFEIDEFNNTYFNEFGASNNTLQAGQSWEIDEPGFGPIQGDIYTNAADGFLDNSNAVPESAPDDVSFALAWDFTLLANEVASISFTLSDVLNTSGFYLTHTDAETGINFDQTETLYFWSDLSISQVNNPPNPPTNANAPSAIALVFISLLALYSRKKLA